MVSEWKRESNRINAQKSTGPRTKRGKRRIELNRSTHRIFCRRLVLAGENRRLFREMRDQMIDVLRPQDVVELMIVHDLRGDYARFLHKSVRPAYRKLVRNAHGG